MEKRLNHGVNRREETFPVGYGEYGGSLETSRPYTLPSTTPDVNPPGVFPASPHPPHHPPPPYTPHPQGHFFPTPPYPPVHDPRQRPPSYFSPTQQPSYPSVPPGIPLRQLSFIPLSKCQRLQFLRKVYVFYIGQLLILNAFMYLVFYVRPSRIYIWNSPTLITVAIALEFFLIFLLVAIRNLRKDSLNVTLMVCSLLLSYLVAVSAFFSNSFEVLVTTSAILSSTSFFFLWANHEKRELEKLPGFLMLIIPIMAGSVIYFIYFPRAVYRIIPAAFGAFLISWLVLWDIRAVTIKNHRVFETSNERACLSIMLLQKATFGICYLICVIIFLVY